MSWLIDTNVISELRKGPRCDRHVAAWYGSIAESDLYLSALVLGEIRKGVELARPRDPKKAETLERWLEQVTRAFAAHVLTIDGMVGRRVGADERDAADPRDRRTVGGDGESQPPDLGHAQRSRRGGARRQRAEPVRAGAAIRVIERNESPPYAACAADLRP